MPRPSSSPTTCAATWTAGRCGRTATRRVIARRSSCGGTRRRSPPGRPAAGAGGGHRRHDDGPGAAPAASAIAPRRRRARPAGRSISSSPASARSGCSTSRGSHPLRKTLLQDAQRFYEEFLDRARRRPRAPRRAGRGPQPARQDHRRDRLAGPGRPPVPAGRRALGEPGRGPARQPGVSGGAGSHPQRSGRDAHAAGGPARRGPRGPSAAPRACSSPCSPPIPRSVSRRHELGLVLQNIGQIQFEQGQPREAIETLRSVLEIEGQLAAEDPRPSTRGSPWPGPMACWARS